jgi:outer membrane protein OmpA-like peptidoglycan-associated protein
LARLSTPLGLKIATGFALTLALTLALSYAALLWKGDALNNAAPPSDAPQPGFLPTNQNIEWLATSNGQVLTLAGSVPSLEAKEHLAALAKAQFPSLRLRDEMRVEASLPATSWEKAASVGLEMMAKVGSGALTLSTISGLSLTGIVADDATRERLLGTLPARMPPDIPGRALLQLPEEAAFLAQQEAARQAAAAPSTSNASTPHPCQAQIDSIMANNRLVFIDEEARLVKSPNPVIEQLGTALRGCGALQLEITAYASSVQGASIAQTLSAQRAQLIADQLVAMGIEQRLIRVTGAGEAPVEEVDKNRIRLTATLLAP